ncbi:MAG: hypothetical protein CMO34_05890 [Verrucomicrobia bacterium]|nr:hypothetical protein [Verrucomicrobiota bacterium]
MRILFFLILIFLTPYLFSQEENEIADRIYWSDWYRLEWTDFQAQPNSDKKVAALSNIALPYSYFSDGEGSMTVNIQVCFLRNESWSKPEQHNNLLLQHEQLHFDIAELHRRIIVKRLLEAKFTKKNYKELLKEIVEEVWKKDYREMQDKYDDESNYSKVIKQQINWNKFVQQQMRNYADYTFTEIEVSLINFD